MSKTNNASSTERARIKARQDVAGRFGFILGCVAAAIAIAINLYRAPRPFTVLGVVTVLLIGGLNIPLGIAVGLLLERRTRDRVR
jgi:zinc transporter ZupT